MMEGREHLTSDEDSFFIRTIDSDLIGDGVATVGHICISYTNLLEFPKNSICHFAFSLYTLDMSCQNPKIQTNHPPILDRGEEVFREIRITKSSCQKYLLLPETDGFYTRKFILEEGAIFR